MSDETKVIELAEARKKRGGIWHREILTCACGCECLAMYPDELEAADVECINCGQRGGVTIPRVRLIGAYVRYDEAGNATKVEVDP